MSTSPTAVRQPLSIAQFEKLHTLLQQFSQSIDAPTLVLTEAECPASSDRFVVVVSSVFCALLTGKLMPEAMAYRVSLQFELEAIARFLDTLSADWSIAPPALPNSAAVQSDFTRQLLETLGSSALLDRIMQQLREQIDLPMILQTSIESIRTTLQVDRVVLYQLHSPQSNGTLLPGGIVAYEARSPQQISVLNLLEVCSVLEHPQRLDRFLQGEVLAVTDIEQRYAAAPCLLQFLRSAQVRSKLVAPIVVRRQLWGLLIAHDCQQMRSWSPVDRDCLRQSGEYLAMAIAQMPIALPTPSLEAALIAAESASRAKSEFLANISHELRTPLTMVIGMSATLLRWSIGELNARQRQYLQTIHDSGDRLLQLINDILDLSQFESGKAALALSDFSLTHLAQQSLQLMQESAIASKVALKLDSTIDPQWDSFRADPRRVQQIVLNLLSNAIKFTPAEGRVTLRLFADERMAVLQVQDTGIGIAEAQKSLLFHKFQQLDSSYQRQYTGAGVGLALTKQLVELHGGSIAVESTLGVGSVFTVRLPRSLAKSTPKVSESPRSAGRIVLIEAHEETAELICDLLTAAGYQVIWLLDGTSAIEQIEILQPVAVIAAEQAGSEGDRLIAAIKQNPLTKSIKTILLTSDLPSGTLADLHLGKPIAPDQLLQSVLSLTAAAPLA
ncbi:GAF domain-containing protein [Microcoleus sp. FACHB-1515]|uniref:hybrid sensor histidine kinase/response regulator n=1 Tax=Cyanophyceae TaxID=3028117 RepID=UPI001689CDE8|nr:ATP-binding protein [Microcoleus sp. FACHB-1515]MBD2092680.1 GAF domain-containing protein [Microcoleus sp. FACHB-1515]